MLIKSPIVAALFVFLCSSADAAQDVALNLDEIHERAKVTERWQPEPEVVIPGEQGRPPSDAIVLFDGDDLDQWVAASGGAPSWRVEDGALTVLPRSGDILTREHFGDVQLHIEWRTPAEVKGEGQGRGNSGVFLMERYEVQVLDSFDNPTYANGQAASVYKQHIPLANASRAPGQWQTYDIIFMAPRISSNGSLLHPATVTVLHNGVLVQNHAVIAGQTVYVGAPGYEAHGEAPLRLQDHGNPVSYRNIWVRRL